MLTAPSRSRLVFVLAPLLAVFALACTSEDAPPPATTPSPEATATAGNSATPSPTSLAPGVIRGTPTEAPVSDIARSREVVNDVIDAVTSGDVDAVESLLLMRNISCSGSGQLLIVPACARPSTTDRVDAFPAGVCVSSWYADPRPILERFVERAGPLIAVTRHAEGYTYEGGPAFGNPDDRRMPHDGFRVVFRAHVGDEMLGYVVVVDDGAISLLELGCRSERDALLRWFHNEAEIVIKGPAFLAPLPEATATQPGDPLAVPRGTHTGLVEYDRIIDAIASQDSAHILEVLHARRMQCTRFGDIGSPPVCDEDELEATVVDAFLTVGCEGAWSRADLPAAATVLANRDIELYAIVGAEIDEFTLFAYKSRDPEMVDTLLYVEGGAVLGYATLGCSDAEDFGTWYPVQFRGPAWPEDAPAAE